MSTDDVIWHDLECGGYDVDLGLWRELAAASGEPVLDVGAGTGRVALDLARRGHEVVALDCDAELLGALEQRAGDAPVTTVVADARDFTLDRTFGLVLVPMQSLQLFDGSEGRAAFLSRAREHLAPGGTIAIAIADVLDGVSGEYVEPPPPDLREIDGTVYSSRPVAVYQDGARVAIQRVREVVQSDGTLEESASTVWLDTLTPSDLERQAVAGGLRVLPRRSVAETDEYVGSTVVMLGG